MWEFKYNYLFPIELHITKKKENITKVIVINNLDDLSDVIGTKCVLCLANFCKNLAENNGKLKHEDNDITIEFVAKYGENNEENKEKEK